VSSTRVFPPNPTENEGERLTSASPERWRRARGEEDRRREDSDSSEVSSSSTRVIRCERNEMGDVDEESTIERSYYEAGDLSRGVSLESGGGIRGV